MAENVPTPFVRVLFAGRIKLELSQYRDLEAFAQFGSDLDADTQKTLARGERLVSTLNQHERAPLAVEDQVVQIYAATNGFLDRLKPERVGEFLAELTERLQSQHGDLRKKIAGGDWSQDTQNAVKEAVATFADDFGFDLDEEGQPIDDDAPPQARSANGGSASEGNDDASDAQASEREEQPQPA